MDTPGLSVIEGILELHGRDSLDTLLEHHGVKGMHWGIRKEDMTQPHIHKLQVVTGPEIDKNLHPSTKAAAKEVSALFADRYGFNITKVKQMDADMEASNPGMIGFVSGGGGKREGVVNIIKNDVRPMMKASESTGWFADGSGNPRSLLTHEGAHALFHADQVLKNGFFGPKVEGSSKKARDIALKAAIKQARKDGIPDHLFTSAISGYAKASGYQEEVEAEMFEQYHWSQNPPKFIKVWGQTLHKELGLDGTPFKEGVKHG